MRHQIHLFSLLTSCLIFCAHAQETETAKTSEEKLNIEKVSENLFKLGDIIINKKTREISFPAAVEISGEKGSEEQPIIEYTLVNPKGKIHESLFISDIKPSHLNIAFKLLGYKESKELFRIVNEDFQPQDEYEKATLEEKKNSRFSIIVKWKDEKDSAISYPIHELILNGAVNKQMIPGPWIYGGSFIHNNQYTADLSGDIFAVFTDRAAIGNYAGKGREDDTLWFPNFNKMAPIGPPVTFSIIPFTDKNQKNK